MNGSQLIILGLIVLTTWISFVEANSHFGYRVTISRCILALIAPTFWAALVIFLPLDNWLTIASKYFLFMPLLVVLIITAPIWLIGSIVVWIGAALCGSLKMEFFKFLRRKS